MVYQWKSGSQHKADANVAGAMCQRMADAGRLTAKNLVDENRPADAPLHDEFEWNDAIAAEAYREDQARNIIRSIVFVTEEQEPVRAFFNLVKAEPEYKTVETILKSANDTDALLQTALKELLAFQKKYRILSQLSGVFRAVDQLKLDLGAKKSKSPLENRSAV